MGLAALRRILEPRPLALSELRDKSVAVDADNLLWTFVTAMRDPPVGPHGEPIAHLIGLTNRLRFYAENGIRSAWVFYGEQPALKDATLAEREVRLEASGGPALTSPQIAQVKELLTLLGVPWMVAPGESDAQCAHFARMGTVEASVTQDYDAALHGSPRTARNLSISKTRTPELIDLDAALGRAKLTRDQLVDVAILIGTDYNPGIPGVGPVKAVKLVQKAGDLQGALEALGARMDNAEEVRALFLAHPVDEHARLDFRAPRLDAVEIFLVGQGLSADRAAAVGDAMSVLHA